MSLGSPHLAAYFIGALYLRAAQSLPSCLHMGQHAGIEPRSEGV